MNIFYRLISVFLPFSLREEVLGDLHEVHHNLIEEGKSRYESGLIITVRGLLIVLAICQPFASFEQYLFSRNQKAKLQQSKYIEQQRRINFLLRLCWKGRRNYVEFRKKHLSGANLVGANLAGANLSGANLKEAKLIGANFSGADLSEADLNFANLNGAKLNGVNLNLANLNGAELIGAEFFGMANLNGVQLNEAQLTTAKLSKANLIGAQLKRAKLNQAHLNEAVLSQADLRGADFRGADLWEADLRDANLKGADLRGADLRGANLKGADLSEANLSGVKLIGTKLLAANFYKAILTGTCLKNWHINFETNLDDVTCDYFYLQDEQQERRPCTGFFEPGEFTTLFQKDLDTIDLIFQNHIDWQDFAHYFREIQLENESAQLDIRSIERKRDDVLVIRVSVSHNANKEKIYSYLKERANVSLETEYQRNLWKREQENIRPEASMSNHEKGTINQLFDLLKS
ncbi:MAG: pentapeptide repeat-containing protein [Symploca sp. SIO2C1]|nr:pentapeptide repeat-containing protein [Symploca sp. SIO2C1]